MTEKDPKEGAEPVEPTPDPRIDELSKTTDLLSEELKQSRSQFDKLSGQLSVIADAAGSVQPVQEVTEELDIVGDPEGAMTKLFNKRTAPILAQNAVINANTQKELVSVKRKEDWDEYKDHVATLVANGKISNEVLSQPGAYDHLLDLAKSKNIDVIVAKQVEAQISEYQSKNAMSGPGVASKTEVVDPADNKYEMTAEEKTMAGKLGVTENKYAEQAKSTTFDGVRIIGAVNH